MLAVYDKKEFPVDRIKAFLSPGTLAAKRAEVDAILVAGDTLYFRGEVSWRVEVEDDSAGGKVLQGHSESLDHAFADIDSILLMLSEDIEDDAVISCSLQNMGGR